MRSARFTKGLLGAMAGCLFLTGAIAEAQEYVTERGQTYKVTKEIARRPVTTTTYQDVSQTVLVDRVTTQMAESNRAVLVPTVEYQWEPRVHDWWNPFRPTTMAYHMIPVTRWEVQQQTVRTPVTYREMVPEERIVRTQQKTLDFVEEEVTRKVAVDSDGRELTVNGFSSGGTAIARRPGPIGGVQQMQDSLPRQGSAIR